MDELEMGVPTYAIIRQFASSVQTVEESRCEFLKKVPHDVPNEFGLAE